MTTKKTLLIVDAYLHDEDSPNLESIRVQANANFGTADLTVPGRDLAITLNVDDVVAIYQLVNCGRKPLSK